MRLEISVGRRETPITLTLADGTIVEGVLDLAFREKHEWTVVDFKTDRELEKEFQQYSDRWGYTLNRSSGRPASPAGEY